MSNIKISKLSLRNGFLRTRFVSGSALILLIAGATSVFAKESSPHGVVDEHAAGSVIETAAQAAALSPDGSVGPIMFIFMFALLIVFLTIAGRISKSHFNRK